MTTTYEYERLKREQQELTEKLEEVTQELENTKELTDIEVQGSYGGYLQVEKVPTYESDEREDGFEVTGYAGSLLGATEAWWSIHITRGEALRLMDYLHGKFENEP